MGESRSRGTTRSLTVDLNPELAVCAGDRITTTDGHAYLVVAVRRHHPGPRHSQRHRWFLTVRADVGGPG